MIKTRLMVCPLRWVISRPSGDYVTGRSGGDHRLEKLKVHGGILLTIIGISIVGLIFDPNVHFSGVFAMPSLSDENGNSLIGSFGHYGRAESCSPAKRSGAGDDGSI